MSDSQKSMQCRPTLSSDSGLMTRSEENVSALEPANQRRQGPQLLVAGGDDHRPTIPEMRAAMEQRQITSRELVMLCLARIGMYEDKLHAVLTVNPHVLE